MAEKKTKAPKTTEELMLKYVKSTTTNTAIIAAVLIITLLASCVGDVRAYGSEPLHADSDSDCLDVYVPKSAESTPGMRINGTWVSPRVPIGDTHLGWRGSRRPSLVAAADTTRPLRAKRRMTLPPVSGAGAHPAKSIRYIHNRRLYCALCERGA